MVDNANKKITVALKDDPFAVNKILTYIRHIPNISERVFLLLNVIDKHPDHLMAEDILRAFSCQKRYAENNGWFGDDVSKTNERSKSCVILSVPNNEDGRYYDYLLGSAGREMRNKDLRRIH